MIHSFARPSPRWYVRSGAPRHGVSLNEGSRAVGRRARTRRMWVRAAQREPNRRRGAPTVPFENDGWDPNAPHYDYPPTRTMTRSSNNGSEAGDFSGLSSFTNALIGGAFILGIGAGVFFTSEVTLEPNNVASTEIVDRRTPNSEICMANGFSSMVFDQRLFVSFNPFNVYVAQPEVKPGCILRRNNYSVLERRKLVSKEMATTCKKEISCVYHSEDAENQFVIDPRRAVMGDGYQAKP